MNKGFMAFDGAKRGRGPGGGQVEAKWRNSRSHWLLVVCPSILSRWSNRSMR